MLDYKEQNVKEAKILLDANSLNVISAVEFKEAAEKVAKVLAKFK